MYGVFYYWGMPAKRIFTQEMIEDLSKIGDVEFSKKWGVSRSLIIRFRKQNKIESFTPKHNTKRKIVDGLEYKWCPAKGGHWEKLEEFRVVENRPGGYAGICIAHDRENRRNYYRGDRGREWHKKWVKTENGKRCLRNTWRKQKAKKDNAYIKWNKEDEERAYKIFDGRCSYCSIQVPFLKIEFDHFIPVASGGKTEPANMVPCCSRCNHGVGGKFKREPWEWLVSKFGEQRAALIYKDIKQKIKIIMRGVTPCNV